MVRKKRMKKETRIVVKRKTRARRVHRRLDLGEVEGDGQGVVEEEAGAEGRRKDRDFDL